MRQALAMGLLLAGLCGQAQGAAAQYFGAMSFSPLSGAMGWGFDYPTQEGAERAALANCKKYAVPDCQIVVVFKDACAALAAGDESFAAVASSSREDAQRRAMRRCSIQGPNCQIMRWVCTSGSNF